MKIVSKKLRESARGQDCTLRLPSVCNYDPATTVLAHLAVGQKGMGMKTPDLFAVFACSACHDAIDGRTARNNWSHADLLRALAETQSKWVQLGIVTVKA